MVINTDNLIENFHLHCDKKFSLDPNFKKQIKSYEPNYLWSIINKSFIVNTKVSKRFLQLRFADLLGGDILCKISYLSDADPSFRLTLLKKGFFEDFDIFDSICLNLSNSDLIREHCSNYCSMDTLTKLIIDKNEKIRSIAFSRLGPKASFDYMYKDPAFSIRKSAASICPYNSKEAFDLANDKSKKVIEEAICKISLDKVLFLLGNSKIKKDKRLLRILKNRLDGYV